MILTLAYQNIPDPPKQSESLRQRVNVLDRKSSFGNHNWVDIDESRLSVDDAKCKHVCKYVEN